MQEHQKCRLQNVLVQSVYLLYTLFANECDFKITTPVCTRKAFGGFPSLFIIELNVMLDEHEFNYRIIWISCCSYTFRNIIPCYFQSNFIPRMLPMDVSQFFKEMLLFVMKRLRAPLK